MFQSWASLPTSPPGPNAYPRPQPDTAHDFEKELTVIVRANAPGIVQDGTWSAASSVKCSYTSSETSIKSNSCAHSTIEVSSSRLKTRPVGFAGDDTMMAL